MWFLPYSFWSERCLDYRGILRTNENFFASVPYYFFKKILTASSLQYFPKFILWLKLFLLVRKWVVGRWDGGGSRHEEGGAGKGAGEMRSWYFLPHCELCVSLIQWVLLYCLTTAVQEVIAECTQPVLHSIFALRGIHLSSSLHLLSHLTSFSDKNPSSNMVGIRKSEETSFISQWKLES